MSFIKDPSLAAHGIQKIEWARQFMPALNELRQVFSKEKPFKGRKITLSVHMEAKTANLALALKEAGAEICATGCNPSSTQDDVAAGLDALGVPVFAVCGATPEEYTAHLKMALEHCPELIIDDGGDLMSILSDTDPQLAKDLIGGCEETTTGVHRLNARSAAGALICPMMNVNDAKSKHYYDNKYGTGQSVWTAIMQTTNLTVQGKTVVVAGYGYCGKGITMRAKGLGANVIVTEVDPFKALEAYNDGFRVMTMDEAAPLGDYFVTSTGCKDVIVTRHFNMMKDNAFLANAGHFNVEVSVSELEALAVSHEPRRDGIEGYTLPNGKRLNLLAEGRLVNLAAGNGHPAEIMDMSFSVQMLALRYLLENKDSLSPAVYEVPESIDAQVAQMRLKAAGLNIDVLTPGQVEYLSGWEV